MPDTIGRRSFLGMALLGVAGIPLGACGGRPASDARTGGVRSVLAPRRRARILLAYFSRPGENYWYGGRRDLAIGNTETLARIIRQRLQCDVYRIRASDPYPDGYDETVARNVREQNADARPAIADPLESIDRYRTILLASPIWNVRTPMIMTSFAERYDFTGKVVHPVTTYAVSGLGDAAADYERACSGAVIAGGLAVRGEKARSARPQVDAWLRRTRLRARR